MGEEHCHYRADSAHKLKGAFQVLEAVEVVEVEHHIDSGDVRRGLAFGGPRLDAASEAAGEGHLADDGFVRSMGVGGGLEAMVVLEVAVVVGV